MVRVAYKGVTVECLGGLRSFKRLGTQRKAGLLNGTARLGNHRDSLGSRRAQRVDSRVRLTALCRARSDIFRAEVRRPVEHGRLFSEELRMINVPAYTEK